MKPLSLHLENVRTFDSLDFEIPEGATALVGSNGSGKTSLVTAIDAALFGLGRSPREEWLSKGRPESKLVLALTFEHGGEVYRVTRSYDGRGRGTSKTDFEKWEDD